MRVLDTLLAGIAYFALGGLWFTPLFGRAWARAVGFERPARWRPRAVYYLGPLLGCLVVASATEFFLRLRNPLTWADALAVGLVAGLGYGAAITTVNAIAPNMPRPGLYALVVGSYHAVGAVLCAGILFWMG
jgi:Protein of unknown function (DUF1761)